MGALQSGPELSQEWELWHEDMEEWAESCCPAAEAMVSMAHAIAQSRPDPESGKQALLDSFLGKVISMSADDLKLHTQGQMY